MIMDQRGGEKIRFALVGSGWRALYYVRIAKALPEAFELTCMVCRSPEKAERLSREYGIRTTCSPEECAGTEPDFVVAAVSKGAIGDVSAQWMERGFPVLSETPAFRTPDQKKRLEDLVSRGGKHTTAEQYRRYPTLSALIKALDSGIIGERDYCMVSFAHEYHGASLIRAFLDMDRTTPFQVLSRTFAFPTAETLSRYERFTDGRISLKKRTLAILSFENGRAALYDFDGEQYRSPIRTNMIRVQGPRGEFAGDTFRFLDENNRPVTESLVTESRTVFRDTDNPNFRQVREITRISFGGETLYSPPFGLCGLTGDETAMALVLKETGLYARGLAGNPYPLEEAAADVRMGFAITGEDPFE